MLDLLFQVASITSGGIFDALGNNAVALQVLNSTRYGFTWVLRVIAAVILMVMMLGIWQWNRRGGTGLWEMAVAVASLGILGNRSVATRQRSTQGMGVMCWVFHCR